MGAPQHASANQRLGDFEILRELGRGGMGIVYEARQVSLNRKVALKVLSGGLGLTPKAVLRFRREAEAAAKLHHTNIVPVYATGEENGTHFYAMELIDGPSLDHVIRQLKASRKHSAVRGSPDPAHGGTEGLPEATGDLRSSDAAGSGDPRRALEATGPYVPQSNAPSTLSASSLSSDSHYFDTVARMVAEVADALEYAHQQGVIHRDLKPSNLLLSPAGRLSLNDFGLARVLEQPGMTLSGEFVGTPAYMSPEQITAGRIPLDHRTDIYSLGATLYELLTLEPPFRGQSREQVLAQIVQKEPRAPRRIQRRVPVDLETICLKCLEKDPDRRYQTAGALAEDLRRYVNRFAISARRAGPVQRFVKWVKRRPAVAASLGVVVVAVCAALAFAYQADRAEQQRALEAARHRSQLLDEKISKAYMIAAGGDLKKTEEVIKEIEELGGSTGQVRLLRGMGYYFHGDASRAISELEQAVKLLPESVTALAILASSLNNDGQFDRCNRMMEEIETLSPSFAEDYLFKGYVQCESGYDGFANLDEGIRRHDSPLGRALRALARTTQARDTGKREDVDEALVDAELARRMVPDNPRILCTSIYTRVVAAVIYGEAKLLERRATLLREAERDIRTLEPFVADQPDVVWAIWHFHEEAGDRRKALEFARRWLEKSGSPGAANYCVIDLYQQEHFKEALACLDQRRRPDALPDLMRAIVLVELDRERVLEEFQKAQRKLPGNELEDWTDILLLLGRREDALAIYRALPDPTSTISIDRHEFEKAKYQFGRGKLSEEGFIATAGEHRWRQSIAHRKIGLFRLAGGDRVAAREHFQKGARYCTGLDPFWCRMFLSRMNKDPGWPSWISPKK